LCRIPCLVRSPTTAGGYRGSRGNTRSLLLLPLLLLLLLLLLLASPLLLL
jgi:hypothetical protein